MAQTTASYPTAPLACWNKAKELRKTYYTEYATAHERGALRWAGAQQAADSNTLHGGGQSGSSAHP